MRRDIIVRMIDRPHDGEMKRRTVNRRLTTTVGSLAATAALWVAVVATASMASAEPPGGVSDEEFIEQVRSLGLEVDPEDEQLVVQVAQSVCVALDSMGSANHIVDAMTKDGEATVEEAQGFVTASAERYCPEYAG